MRLPACIVTCVLTLAATSCDPLFSTRHRQALVPAAPAGCLANVLRGSALVAAVTVDSVGRDARVLARFQVAVRDTATRGGHWDGEVAETADENGTLWATVTYTYAGFAQPTDDQRIRWDAQSRELLEQLRQACAPEAPPAVECQSLGGFGGNRRACRTAA